MDIKKKIREYYTKDYTRPINFMGIKMNIDKDFLDWFIITSEIMYKNLNKSDVQDVIDFLIEKYDLNKNYIFIPGEDCSYSFPNECYIGIQLRHLKENFSIKRLKIDMYNDFVKMGLISRDRKLDCIKIYCDSIFLEDKEIKKLEKKIREEKKNESL